MNNTNLQRRQQSLTPGTQVELFILDLSSIPTLSDPESFGTIYRFYPSNRKNDPILVFGGDSYTPHPMAADGFEVSSKGRLPTPKIRLANVDRFVSTIINNLGDPIGAKVTRFLTFTRFLEGGEQPDGEAIFLPQVFVIERKFNQTEVMVEFELKASMDQEGRFLPKRQILQDACTHIYRRWNGTEFIYTEATCPWTGGDEMEGGEEGPFFNNEDEEVTDPAKDICGHRLNSCKVRHNPFGIPLPTRQFVGVARIRQRR